MRQVLRRDLQAQVRDIRDSLDAGRRTFTPDVKGIAPKMSELFESHRDRVIHVAVSDGIQEVTPENELGLWQLHPIEAPVEDTLTTNLAAVRDQVSVNYIKKWTVKRNTFKLADLVKSELDAYLRFLKDQYLSEAREWIIGESTVVDVEHGLSQVLRKTDNESERIFRTETTNYFNRARHDYFAENTDVDYIELYAVTDGRVSRICETRHGFVLTIARAGLKKYMPAFHPHCRTIQRALFSALTAHKPIIKHGLAMSESLFAPLPKGWT